ncbi:MAG: hypothetical protein Q4F67_12490 [Propionibacteriaceae bacterium]|nr:hypothetical protein [Propionibacteriaceae bacterium]
MNSLGLSRNFVIGQGLFFIGFGIMALFFFQPWRSCPEGEVCATTQGEAVGFIVGAVLGIAGLILTFLSVIRRNQV